MSEDTTIVGLVEDITILDGENLEVKARIDTGATVSSVDASIVENLDVPSVGKRIVKSSHGTTKRQMVMLKIRLGEKIVEGKFTVFDRSHMTYPILIGQNILKQGFIIDPQKD